MKIILYAETFYIYIYIYIYIHCSGVGDIVVDKVVFIYHYITYVHYIYQYIYIYILHSS